MTAAYKPRNAWGHQKLGGHQVFPLSAQEKPASPTLWSQTSSLQNCETINFCCLSYSVCGILLRQPQETNALLFPEDLKCPAAEVLSENLFSLRQGLYLKQNKNWRSWSQTCCLWINVSGVLKLPAKVENHWESVGSEVSHKWAETTAPTFNGCATLGLNLFPHL